ncbi:MAG: hypothetical protein JJE04_16820 [Acidobacteriia bacterium]|nr:hypothetical protein [Terriglobia bacterium]
MGQNDLSEYVFERDRIEFSLGDTLDMKTGLLLAGLTFLAIQSSSLMASTPPLPRAQFILQALSIAFIVLGGIFCAIELWPRDYMREAMPDEYEVWIAGLDEYRKQYPDVEIPGLPAARFSSAKQRIQTNGAINKKKSAFMFLAFYSTVAAFAANLATMTMRLF